MKSDTRCRPAWTLVTRVCVVLVTLTLLPVVPATGSSHDEPEYQYDLEPSLGDKRGTYSWFTPPAEINRLGYEGDFSFTVANGDDGDDQLDNWAYWSFGAVEGRYEVQAYIPPQYATAYPQYLIWADSDGDATFSNDEYVAGPYLNQASGSGWRTVGEYDLRGDVRIEVRDTRARDDYRTVGIHNARLAADAMRLKRVTESFPPGQVELTSIDYEVTNRNNGSGRVVWGSVPEATSYDLRVTFGTENINDGQKDEVELSPTNVSCCSRSFAANSGWKITAVQVSIRAVNESGAGVWSAPIISGISYPVARPGAISGLRYSRSDSRIIWSPERVATAYDIEWKQPTSGTSRTVVVCSNSDNSLSGSSCALQITRIRHEALEYRVRAKNKNGTQFGPWSSWNTDGAEAERPVETPGTVSGIRYQSGRIVWQTAQRATAYDVDWRYPGENTTRQTVICSTSCSLGVSRDPTRVLEFRVRGKNGGGNGPWSRWSNESAEIKLPGTVGGIEYRSERIVWRPASDAVAYDVEWKNEGESVTRDSVTCRSTCSLTVRRVAGKRLEFRVRGKNDAGRGPWSDWVHEAAQVASISRPTVPRNLRLTSSSDGVLSIAWDSPSNTGGAPITAYTRVVTRPDGANTKRFTRVRAYESESATFQTLRPCTTYTVHIAAQNSAGTGPFATASIYSGSNLGSRGNPPTPRDLTVRTVQGLDNRLLANWQIPDNSDTCGVKYEVRWSRADGRWSNTIITSRQNSTFTGLPGVAYNVRVRSLRNGKSSRAIHYEDFVALPRPRMLPVKHESEFLLIVDDADAVIRWRPVTGALNYALDWRYMEIDSERLNELYEDLKNSQLPPNEREVLEKEANQLLDGTEISPSFVSGGSAPNADPTAPEVNLWNNGEYHDTRKNSKGCKKLSIPITCEWDTNSDPIEFRIESRNDKFILQARVRAIGPSSSQGPWSDWVYHPTEQFSAGCRSLNFYKNIKDILKAIEIAGWVVTVAGVVAAAVTAGSSTLAAQAIKSIAVQIARKVARDLTLKKILREIAKQAIDISTDAVRGNFLRFIFGCATHAVDGGLNVDNIDELGVAIIRESWEDIKETDWTQETLDQLIGTLTD